MYRYWPKLMGVDPCIGISKALFRREEEYGLDLWVVKYASLDTTKADSASWSIGSASSSGHMLMAAIAGNKRDRGGTGVSRSAC